MPRCVTNVVGSMIAVISSMVFTMALHGMHAERPKKLKSPKPKRSPYKQKMKNKYRTVVNNFGFCLRLYLK